jgi:hypothetical protein
MLIVNLRQQFCTKTYKKLMADKNEGKLAGKHRDMGIKTIEGQDNEGHIHGSQQSSFDEQRTQERQKEEDNNELNSKDMQGTGPV